jgi:hypothetical protein
LLLILGLVADVQKDEFEMQAGAIQPGQNVIVIE